MLKCAISQIYCCEYVKPNTNTFQVIPVEEWYTFQPKLAELQRLTVEEAETQVFTHTLSFTLTFTLTFWYFHNLLHCIIFFHFVCIR
jgi:hypothetical protein